ncbi:MAG: hypothetical protein R3250_01995, partial [Melioribacteraceae bacterium]|nr:hypothetical protein [Melioribacteraceae bacterium]
MFCRRCGWNNEQHASYCLDCGQELIENQVESNKKMRYFIITCSVMLLSIMGVAYSIFSTSAILSKELSVSASGYPDVSANDKNEMIKEIQSRVYTISTEA